MTILEATPDITKLPPLERSKYSFLDLANFVARADNNEILIETPDLRQAGFLVKPFWETPGDLEGDCYGEYIVEHPDFNLMVRRGVLDCLLKAQAKLPSNWQIVLKAGFRPLEVQLSVLQAFINENKKQYPSWNDEKHLDYARLFVADPEIVCPAHTTGGAIDIDIIDIDTCESIEMGCPINTNSETAFIFSEKNTAIQHHNRMTLLEAMLDGGFAPNVNEWWHFQYGETYWAAFYGQEQTLYDIIPR